MNRNLLIAGAMGIIACSSSEHGSTSGSAGSISTRGPVTPGFRPVASVYLQRSEFAKVVKLPVPVKREDRLTLAGLHLLLPAYVPGTPTMKLDRDPNEVTVPCEVVYADARTGEQLGPASRRGAEFYATHFGVQSPSNGVVGQFNDPTALSSDRAEALRQRIFAALDVLLPFFADGSRPWTEEANKAARDVRDFFPIVAEPGLWPYYKAEGREFFAWVEKNAPAPKAPLPWEVPGVAPSASAKP